MFHRALQRLPALVTVLACQRVLHVAENRVRGCIWIREAQTFDETRIVLAEFLEPVLGALAEIVECAHETPSFRGACVRLFQAGRRFRSDRSTVLGGNSLAADRRRPSAR